MDKTITIDFELYELIEYIAEKNGIKPADVIEDAVNEYFSDDRKEYWKERNYYE